MRSGTKVWRTAKRATTDIEDAVRPQWLYEIVSLFQGATLPFSDSLPSYLLPTYSVERRIYAALLSDPRRKRCSDLLLGVRATKPGPQRIDAVAVERRVKDSVERAVLLLNSRHSDRWTLERLARRVGCNRTDLEAGFRRIMLCTYREYLNRCRVGAARDLLTRTQWRVVEIARSVGHASKASFYSNFERLVALTPEQYRQAWRPVSANAAVLRLLHSGFTTSNVTGAPGSFRPGNAGESTSERSHKNVRAITEYRRIDGSEP